MMRGTTASSGDQGQNETVPAPATRCPRTCELCPDSRHLPAATEEGQFVTRPADARDQLEATVPPQPAVSPAVAAHRRTHPPMHPHPASSQYCSSPTPPLTSASSPWTSDGCSAAGSPKGTWYEPSLPWPLPISRSVTNCSASSEPAPQYDEIPVAVLFNKNRPRGTQRTTCP
jgi:hypothetical protein